MPTAERRDTPLPPSRGAATTETHERLLAQNTAMAVRLGSLRAENTALHAERATALAQMEALQDQLHHLEARLEDQAALHEHAQNLARACEAYRSSTSWRLTAPVRWLSRLLGRRP